MRLNAAKCGFLKDEAAQGKIIFTTETGRKSREGGRAKGRERLASKFASLKPPPHLGGYGGIGRLGKNEL